VGSINFKKGLPEESESRTARHAGGKRQLARVKGDNAGNSKTTEGRVGDFWAQPGNWGERRPAAPQRAAKLGDESLPLNRENSPHYDREPRPPCPAAY